MAAAETLATRRVKHTTQKKKIAAAAATAAGTANVRKALQILGKNKSAKFENRKKKIQQKGIYFRFLFFFSYFFLKAADNYLK